MQLPLVIGTRGSPLALAQTRAARAALAAALGVPDAEADARLPIRTITTTGDRVVDRALAEAGGKGLFTKELEEALLDGRIDLAVHSMKDVPSRTPAPLVIAAVLEREDPRDALIAAVPRLADLPQGARVGTASARRRAQALRLRPDLSVSVLRGNVGTRADKVAAGAIDATFLALAGLRRLGQADLAAGVIAPEEMLPAPAQGAVGVQTREDDAEAREAAARLDHGPTAVRVAAERAVVDALDATCRSPIAALAELSAAGMRLRAEAYSADGARRWAEERALAADASLADADAFGRELGEAIRVAAGDGLGWTP